MSTANEAVASGLSDVIDVESDEPTIVDVDTSGERDDDGIDTDAKVMSLPIRLEPSDVEITPGTSLVPVRDELKGLTELAVTLAIADNTPRDLKGKPAAVLAVFLTGRELGIPPMTALRTCHVIDGKVTVAPKVRAAMVRREGLGRLWPHQGPRDILDDTGKVTGRRLCKCGRDYPDNDGDVCTWHAERADDPGVIYSSTYTLAMAEAVKIKSDGSTLAGKDNWKNYPERMLSWRSLGYLLDDAFPEVGTGLYSPDELGAITDEEGAPIIDVDSTEVLTERAKKDRADRGPAKEQEPPASPDTIAEFQRRIEAIKAYEDAPSRLLGLWNGYRGENKDQAEPLPKVEDLLYRHCPVATGLIAMIERRIQAGEFKQVETDAEIVDDESTTDADENPEDAPDGVDEPSPEAEPSSDPDDEEGDREVEDEPTGDAVDETTPPVEDPPVPRVFDVDVAKLPTGLTPADDLAWTEAAIASNPETARALIDEVAHGVQEIRTEDLTSIMKLLDLSANGLNEATKRARIAARRVRLRIAKDAGV